MNESDDTSPTAILVGDQIFDVDARTWRGSLGALAPRFVHEGPVSYLLDDEGKLCAVELATASVLWRRPVSGDPQLVAVGHDDLLVATPGEVWSFSKADGVGREVAWFEEVEVEHLAHLGQYAAVGLTDSSIQTYNLLTGEHTATVLPWPCVGPEGTPADRRPIPEGPVGREDTFVLPSRRMTFTVVTELDRYFDLRCFDAFGALVWQRELEHTAVSWVDGAARVLDKRIDLREVSRRWILFGPCGPGEASALVRLSGGEVTHLERDVSAVVEDSEGWVRGFVSVDADRQRLSLLEPDGREVRWEHDFDFAPCNQAAVSLGRHGAIVALYHPVHRDVVVSAVDLSTGQTQWRARLSIPRTSYRLRHELNRVSLLHTDRALVVRVDQAPRSFVFVLDPDNGRCVFPDFSTLNDAID